MRTATWFLLGVFAASHVGVTAKAQEPSAGVVADDEAGSLRASSTTADAAMESADDATEVSPPIVHSTRFRSGATSHGRRRQRGSAPIRVGMSVFSGAAGLSLVIGQTIVFASLRNDCTACRRDGFLLILPVAGPAIGLGISDQASARTLFAIAGGLELAGLLVAGLGAIPRRDRNPGRRYGSDYYVGVDPFRITLHGVF